MKMKVTTKAARLFGPVGVTAGLATFFFGISGWRNSWPDFWTNIIAGVILIIIGFILSFIYLGRVEKKLEHF
jgi:uncharacterized membrane protein